MAQRRKAKRTPERTNLERTPDESEFIRRYLEWMNWEEPNRTPWGMLNPLSEESRKVWGLATGEISRPPEPPSRSRDIYLPPPYIGSDQWKKDQLFISPYPRRQGGIRRRR